jgi:putative glutamine amidotransferase
MAKPLVGITCRHEPWDAERTYHSIYPYDFQFTPYAERVARAGGVPVWLPNVSETLDPPAYLDRIDILLLAGGDEDIHPKHYREEIEVDNLYLREPRDAYELPLIKAFWDGKRPIFAICRGIQALNVALGGTLYQDLAKFPNASEHTRGGKEYTRTHAVRIIPDSTLARISGCDELTVNTAHHQMIKDVAPGLRAVAWSTPDGIIEAVEASDGRPVLGVQWHPEMMDDESSERLFKHLTKI